MGYISREAVRINEVDSAEALEVPQAQEETEDRTQSCWVLCIVLRSQSAEHPKGLLQREDSQT